MIRSACVLLGVLVLPLVGCATMQSGPASISTEGPLIPEVRVDERVELLAIIFRLAGAEEYSKRYVPAYADAINAHFGQYRDHPAVLAARELRQQHSVSFNAVVDLAVQLGSFPDLAERAPLEGAQLDPRWRADAARSFLEKVRSFAVDTNAAAFFASQRPLYAVAEQRMRDLVANEADLRWVQRFYGGSGRERFVVVPAPGNGDVAYGSRYYGPNGEREFYATVNVMQVDEDGRPAFSVGYAPLLVHEFGHSYVTPLIVERYDELRPAGELLLQTFRDQMAPHGYLEGSTVIHESIIRAGVARYKLAHVGPDAARRELDRQRRLGFAWIGDLYELLGTYEQNRRRYPTFADFFPVLRDYFSRLPERLPAHIAAYDALRPTVVESNPAQGSQNVDPATTSLTLRFSRRMARRWGILSDPARADLVPEITGISLDEGRTVLTIGVKLQPNRRYEMPLVGGPTGMGAEDGVLLAPYTIRFSTGPARPRG